MKRSKFPYTARSKAKVIRHAVSIDERRAKFRSDLISESKVSNLKKKRFLHRKPRQADQHHAPMARGDEMHSDTGDRFRKRSRLRLPMAEVPLSHQTSGTHEDHLDPRRSTNAQLKFTNTKQGPTSELDDTSIHSEVSSFQPGSHVEDEEEEQDEEALQDIEELWFPGCHADLGGGWPLADGEESPLSHAPLVWMVREAQHAGLDFDPEKLLAFKCCNEDYRIPYGGINEDARPPPDMPEIQITSPPTESRPDIFRSPKSDKSESGWAPGLEPPKPQQSDFHKHLHLSSTRGILHDCLEFNNGLPMGSVLSWRMMEYLPFRRMDLQPDGSWKAISLPLPMGETRDIPENAWIHHSAIRRMEANEEYRPGNLIIGGGGRGVRKAPKELGIGKWKVLKEEGDAVGMTYVRKGPSLEKQLDEGKDETNRGRPKATANGK